jgi:hypothetical protein
MDVRDYDKILTSGVNFRSKLQVPYPLLSVSVALSPVVPSGLMACSIVTPCAAHIPAK